MSRTRGTSSKKRGRRICWMIPVAEEEREKRKIEEDRVDSQEGRDVFSHV